MNELSNYEAFLIQGVTTMKWDQIKSNWIQVCDKIKVTWGKLSEDDLAAIV